ncbi:MAG: DUF1302 family protein [Pseudomonadota bacterium]
MKNEFKGRISRTTMAASIALGLTALAGGSARADSFNVGNPDIELRWDNTIRYTGGMRMKHVNPAFLGVAGYDETEGRFTRGDFVTNRIDLLSELDFTYMRKYGFRVSGAAWNDFAYDGKSRRNTALPVSGAYINDQYNGYVDRYIRRGAEILDAFVFGNFDLGPVALSVKAGQHNVYWGESLYSIGNSMAYSQGPVDTIKAATSPGAEAKELFLPLKQISAQAQLTDELSIAAQYSLDWKPFRLVPGGTYFAPSDGSRSDFAANFPGAFNLANGEDFGPEKTRGNFGVNLRYSPAALQGSVGLYYRKFDEKLPWSFTQLRRVPVAPFVAPQAIRLAFARDTELLGVSFTRNINSVSVGAELSYRKGTALNSPSGFSVLPANVTATSPTYAEAEGARGNTIHGLINGIWLMPENSLWKGGTLQGELNFSHLNKVTRNANRFFGEGFACPAGQSKKNGCATKTAFGMNLGFTPEWPQLFAGWDISMPTSLAYQIRGNGAALGGGNEGSLSYSIGVAGKLYSKYEFSLRYADASSRYNTNPLTGLFTNGNGSNAVQSDHDWLVFTFKTSF